MADEARILAEALPAGEPRSGVGAQLEDAVPMLDAIPSQAEFQAQYEERFRAEVHFPPLVHLLLPADFHATRFLVGMSWVVAAHFSIRPLDATLCFRWQPHSVAAVHCFLDEGCCCHPKLDDSREPCKVRQHEWRQSRPVR